jgi:hypothetical protein
MQGGATGSSARPKALKTLATKVFLSFSLSKPQTLKRLTRALTFARLGKTECECCTIGSYFLLLKDFAPLC